MSQNDTPRTSHPPLPVQAQLVDIAHQHIPAGILATMFNNVVIVYALWEVTNTFILLSWFIFVFATNIGRLLEVYLYRHRQMDLLHTQFWARAFSLGAILAGIGWGLAAVLLIPADSIAHQMIMVVIIAGTIAGSTSTLASLSSAFIPFCLLSLLPLTFTLVMLGSQLHLLIAIISVIFMLFMLSTGKVNRHNLITALTLTDENSELLHKLEAEKQQAINLNNTLKHEIEQRLLAEIELKRKEQSLEDAQRIAKMGSWESVSQTDQFSLSSVMTSLLGLSEEQNKISQNAFLSRILASDRIKVEQIRNEALQNQRSYQVEYQIVIDHALTRTVEEQGVVRTDRDGATIGLAAIVLDITHRKETDKLKNEFISTVSHELRTPLTSISGTLSLLESNAIVALPDKAHHLVSVAHRNALRLTHLVNDILDIDKLGFGGLPLELKKLDLIPVVRDAIEDNLGYAENLHVGLQLTSSPESLFVYGDTERLIQVLTNLLSNAAKYSPANGVVEIGVHEEKDRVRVEVVDHGPGIAEEFRDKVFQKFSQGDTSDSRFQYGSGLGLSIAQLIVEKHHGRIGFDTRLGTGTTFWFELPRID